ncbi:MAG: hypothetical protein NUV75_12735 [Gallionella sp.]|nr:hypothetical protein [Gallionella sp.]
MPGTKRKRLDWHPEAIAELAESLAWYQTLINETLKQAVQAENLEAVVRKTIREEMRKAA